MKDNSVNLNRWPGARDADGFLTDVADIISWLAAAGVPRDVPRLRSDGVVDSWHDIDLSHKNLTRLPVRFGEVAGSFLINNNNLSFLGGAPSHVGGRFLCGHNRLLSLVSGPWRVDGEYNCEQNLLVDFEGCADALGADLYAGHNRLNSWRGIPSHCFGDVAVEGNRLTGFLGGPETIDGSLNAADNPLDLSGLRVPSVKSWLVVSRSLLTDNEIAGLTKEGLGRLIGGLDSFGELSIKGVDAGPVLEKIALIRGVNPASRSAAGRSL